MKDPAIPELDHRGLRNFGLTSALIVIVIFGLIFPWLFADNLPYWPWLIGLTLGVCALLAPARLRTVYRLWMRFGILLNRITTPVILGILFFMVFTPVAIVLRLIKRDSLARTFDRDAGTYRKPSRVRERESVERPF